MINFMYVSIVMFDVNVEKCEGTVRNEGNKDGIKVLRAVISLIKEH